MNADERRLPRLTLEEFERLYAEKLGMTVDQLHAEGLHAVACGPECDYEKCHGWKMDALPVFPALRRYAVK